METVIILKHYVNYRVRRNRGGSRKTPRGGSCGVAVVPLPIPIIQNSNFTLEFLDIAIFPDLTDAHHRILRKILVWEVSKLEMAIS